MPNPTPRALFAILLLALILPSCRRNSSGHRTFKVGGGRELVDPGDPVLPPAPGYAGSTVCRDCHADIFDTWAETFHNVSTRRTDREGAAGAAVVGDANGNGLDDFQDGLDLATDPDFAPFGANAPKLSFVSGDELPYKVTIGAVTYAVWRTVGGNGIWRQRYLTRIGESVHVLPVQVNESTDDWVPYATDTWYDGAGAPRFADGGTVAAQIDPAASFDLSCAGCHATGFDIEFGAAAGQYLSGYTEISVGCENCHGPGQAHVDGGGDRSQILNPASLLDGTVEGVLAADLICGRCHSTGIGGIPAGGGAPAHYPWLEGSSTFPPGNTNIEDYFTFTADPADFWRRKDNPMGFAPTPTDPTDDTFLAARSAEMQFIDLLNGPHGPDKPTDATCFDCHDPHSRAQAHQIRTEITRGGETVTGTSVANNSLCLACHQTFGEFDALTAAEVDAITDAGAPAAVVDAVVAHMKDKAGMPIEAGDYDPTGDGAGRCAACHELSLSTSAATHLDAAGNTVGDVTTHTFLPVWPRVSELTTPKITNSCNRCHPLDPGDIAGDVIAEWVSDPDDDSTFHADTPRNFQSGVANHARNGGVACAGCHTTEGFLRIQVEGASIHDLTGDGDADLRTEIVKSAIGRDEGITCRACHGRQPDGTFAAGVNPLRFPKAELCGRCHNNETVEVEDYVAEGEIVRHPMREMLGGREGGEVPGLTYTDSPHTAITGGDCTQCHFRTGIDRKHDFAPRIEACRACHSGLADFNRPAFGDYDGDGVTEGIQDEVTGALAVLETAILAAPTSTPAAVTYAAPYFLIDGDRSNTAALDSLADAGLLRAMFNHYWVRFDGSRGVHNTAYALQLIQRSYEELTGLTWPGVKK